MVFSEGIIFIGAECGAVVSHAAHKEAAQGFRSFDIVYIPVGITTVDPACLHIVPVNAGSILCGTPFPSTYLQGNSRQNISSRRG